jgi:integrase
MTGRDDLEPLAPEQAKKLYIEGRRDELAEATLDSHGYRLDAFVAWCEEKDIENLNELSGRDLYEYRVWRREGEYADDGPVTGITLRGNLATLRAFLHFAADIDAVPEALAEKVALPNLDPGEDVSDTTLDPERAKRVLEHLNRFEYASRAHVTVLLAWHTGARTGGLRALDVRDCDLDGDDPGIEFKHRSKTPLKNKATGERWNAISTRVARILKDYIDTNRHDVTDDEGRRPLITTIRGRPHPGTIRHVVYCATRPCQYGAGCPHDRDPETCEAATHDGASKCPSSRSPHDVRSGRVTAYRRGDVPRQIVSDRLNASEDVLDKHYDRRGERERAEQRRDHIEEL